jgi:hypothetical protein
MDHAIQDLKLAYQNWKAANCALGAAALQLLQAIAVQLKAA